ncbi:MAG: four helix bundle protein [Prevotella sp.]|nr:four helix bundle protein [Prevotella sp.]
MGPYQNLVVWQKSMVLAKDIFDVTARFPKSETFGLVSQMRRCAVSIPSNIAEGYGRGTNKDLVHFLYVSLGSSNELETQLILSRDFEYLNEEESSMLIQLNEQVNKMLSSLIYTRKESDEIK